MPGIVVFKRRWSVGSDDLVVPAVALVVLHSAWIVILSAVLVVVDFNERNVTRSAALIRPLADDANLWVNRSVTAGTDSRRAGGGEGAVGGWVGGERRGGEGTVGGVRDGGDVMEGFGGRGGVEEVEGGQDEMDGWRGCRSTSLLYHVIACLSLLCLAVVVEASAVFVSMRGTILETAPRSAMKYLLYIRLGILIVELAWQVWGVVWVAQNYRSCSSFSVIRVIVGFLQVFLQVVVVDIKIDVIRDSDVILAGITRHAYRINDGVIVCNWFVILSVIISLWCTFDSAGRSWVKMKRYQESLKGRESRAKTKRCSGTSRRNWRQRKAMRKYEQSWDRRCQFLFCCVKEDRHRNSFTEVAKLFTDFFRDLDVVPTDVVAGLMLLRKHQRLRRADIVSQGSNEVYKFLSGVPITPSTKFLTNDTENEPNVDIKRLIHYMKYALAAYGWPMYMVMNTGSGLCKILPHLRCCCCRPCCCQSSFNQRATLIDDNCCQCNFAALRKLTGLNQTFVVYATYHVDIGETPFFIAVDHDEKTIVIAIRGTLSLQDVLTDLKADAEILPVDPPKEDWLAHKGMVQAAAYIRKKIKDEQLLSIAFGRDPERGTQNYDVTIVGHSLGAGTAAILAILLRQEYPSIHCYAFSPPGGLLSVPPICERHGRISSRAERGKMQRTGQCIPIAMEMMGPFDTRALAILTDLGCRLTVILVAMHSKPQIKVQSYVTNAACL